MISKRELEKIFKPIQNKNLYILCESDNKIFPIEFNSVASIYGTEESNTKIHIETFRNTKMSITLKGCVIIDDQFEFNLYNGEDFRYEPICDFLRELNNKELKRDVSVRRLLNYEKTLIELSESSNPIKKDDFLRSLPDIRNAISISIKGKSYSILPGIVKINTTYVKGIGLNRKVVKLGTNTIMPGEAIVIYSELQPKSEPICDFSLYRRRYKLPKKYTELLMKLSLIEK